jgi:predicted AlkP superfamily phosphohydrolase/phosphomutase
MGPNFAACHLVPELLNRLGYFYSAGVGQSGSANGGSTSTNRVKKSLLSTVRDSIPLSVRRSVARCLPRALNYRLSMKWTNANIDWTKTRAFSLPNANEGYVRLNLRGREPQGIVESGREYADLLAALKASFDKLVNPQNGRKAAHQIICTDEVFPGEQRHHLPDLVVNWDIDARILAELVSDKTGLVRKEAGYETAPYYTGNHRPTAFVLARGPKVPQGKALSDGYIVDFAPTILAMLGVDPPPHMDGRVWGEFAGGAS